MISGRGLGHTGGTLDKMGSIPGYDAVPARETFRRVVRDVGCAIIGQTDDLAPADKRLYAIRDVTATVESVPLITASILSKKLAAGLDGLAMDVKFGNGAFMTSREDAQELADALVEVAVGAGLPTSAVLTDMNQPLASAAGNAVEVVYAIDYLTGARREPRMHDVVVTLGAEMLVLASLATDAADGRTKIERALDGAATEKFAEMVTALGGPEDLVEFPGRHLERADVEVAVTPEHAGRVSAIDTRAVGLAVVTLGGGRTRPQDPIDPAVGLTELAELGSDVGRDRPLAMVHARTAEHAELAADQLRAAYTIDH
jgi:thymidine phosphorylase